jgi:tetratricopeptide (TPR) repeat protein
MKSIAFVLTIVVLTCSAMLFGQEANRSNDYHAWIKQGNEALAHNQWTEAARDFQRAVDLNSSSAKAHEGLGVALFRQLAAENVRPSAYSDVVDRAESHLQEACQFSPSATRPLLELSELEAYLARNSSELEERTGRYRRAQDLLKQVISLEPSELEIYLRLANLERDEFGPPMQEAKARFATTAGPIPDLEVRHDLQNRYRALVDDAITNALRASEMNGTAQRPLLLLARLFRERALIRDRQEQYAFDMQSANDWERQFIAVGGHIGNTANRND